MNETWRRILWISQLLATVSLSIGILALCGYVGDHVRLYQWHSTSVAMAIPTAVAVASLGISVFFTIEYIKRRVNGNRPHHK